MAHQLFHQLELSREFNRGDPEAPSLEPPNTHGRHVVELVRTCLDGHPARATASVVPWDGDFSCDNCGQEMPAGARMWRCFECDMELCSSCCHTPPHAQASQASHSLVMGQNGEENPGGGERFPVACRHRLANDEEESFERVLHQSTLRSLEVQQKALRVGLQRHQARLDKQSAALERMRQRWPSTTPEQQELGLPLLGGAGTAFAALPRHQMMSGRRGTNEANMDRDRRRSCRGSRIVNGESHRRTTHRVSFGAIRTIDRTSAKLAKRWEEVQRAPSSEKRAKLRQIEQLKAHPDFVAAQRTLREAPALSAL